MSTKSAEESGMFAEIWGFWKNNKITPVFLVLISLLWIISWGIMGVFLALTLISVWIIGFIDGGINEIQYQIKEVEAQIAELESKRGLT